MAETYHLALPLVAAAQAQKHVTVNEALARLDAVAQLRVVSAALSAPPVAPLDGQSYLVASGGSGDWQGHDGAVALWANGGWVFLQPRAGWRLWDEAAARPALHDGAGWVWDAVATGPGGAATVARVIEVDHVIASGASSTVAGLIPSHAQVTGITGRVSSAIIGTATGWRLGVPGADNRYGSGLGTALNAYALGLSGTPVTYYAPTDVVLTAEGGNFGGGAVRLAVHLVELLPPREV